MYYLDKGIKINFPSILFKYLREMVKETRSLVNKPRKWIPLGMLIFDILVESRLVAKLEEMNFRVDLYTNMGKSLNGRNLKNMLMITDVVNPVGMDREFFSTRRVEIDDFPLFTKLDPSDVLMAYMKSFLEDGIDSCVDIHNLMDVSLDATLKRKRKYTKDYKETPNHPSSPDNKPKKSEISRRTLRSVDIEASEVQKREATEFAKSSEVARVVEVVIAVEVISPIEPTKASEATEVAKAIEDDIYVEESRHMSKEAEREAVEASGH